MLMWPPSARPSSACPPDVTTCTCSRASTPYVIPLRPAASSLAESPSTMKLFDRLRWLLIDKLIPGTADVSGNSCALPTLVGDTPGTRSASSRKLRPLSGTLWTSACGTVPAIWLRAASRTVVSPVTVTLVSTAPTVSDTGSSKAAPTVRERRCVASRNPGLPTTSSYNPTRRYGNLKRPSRPVAVVAVTPVFVFRAATLAPSTTAPDGSATRPLMLA